MKHLFRALLLAVSVSQFTFAEELPGHQGEGKAEGVMSLSSAVRDLLSQEMLALQQGMMSIIPAYVSGDWSAIAVTAGKMKNSYIFKQSLTKGQRAELHSQLPHDFVAQDKQFHYLAGMLEHVAQRQKPELINFYFSEMAEACVSCHSDYARHKFPALAPAENEGHSH